jgi:tetratricopeptide (TPR) repeat protein
VRERITAHLAGVQERLRASERERAVAEARAEEGRKRRVLADSLAVAERRRRRTAGGLAAAVLAAAAVGGGAASWVDRQHRLRLDGLRQSLARIEALEAAAARDPDDLAARRAALAAADEAVGTRGAYRRSEPGRRLVARRAALAGALDRAGRDPEPTREGLRAELAAPDPAARRDALIALAASEALADAPTPTSLLLAQALREAGDADAALGVLRAAAARDPGDVWANYNLAEALASTPPFRNDEAIRFYSVARALRPETAHNLAHLLDRRGRDPEAEAVFRDLIGLRPDDPRHLGCFGRFLAENGRPALARPALDRAIDAFRGAPCGSTRGSRTPTSTWGPPWATPATSPAPSKPSAPRCGPTPGSRRPIAIWGSRWCNWPVTARP